jgi:hypothetical protein
MSKDNIPIYVISLRGEFDRRAYLIKKFKSLGVEFTFIDATTPKMLSEGKQNSAIAIWDSHVKALKEFLKTDFPFACIFEDDIDLERHFDAKMRFFSRISEIASCIPGGFSILQLGTMSFRKRNIFFVSLRELYFLLHNFYAFDKPAVNSLRNSIGSQALTALNRKLSDVLHFKSKPVEGFQTGMQAYLCNRSAAKYLVAQYLAKTDWDQNSRLSLDTYLESQSKTQNAGSEIRAIRLSKQLFEQRPLPSSNTFYPEAK